MGCGSIFRAILTHNMRARSLYDELGESVKINDHAHGETSITRADGETVDDRRSADTAYTSLATRDRPGSIDRGRTERTAMTETIDEGRSTADPGSSLLPSGQFPRSDPGRTEQTATVETIDRDRASTNGPGPLLRGSLYGHATKAVASDVDRGRTEKSTAPETIDNDRLALHDGSSLFRPTDLYAALATSVTASVPDRGRTEITEAESGETIDNDRSPDALWA